MSLRSIYKNMKGKKFRVRHNNGQPIRNKEPRVRMSKKERIKKRWERRDDERFENEKAIEEVAK